MRNTRQALIAIPCRRGDIILIRTAGTSREFLCDKIHEGVQPEKQKPNSWQALVLGNTMIVISYLRQIYSSETAATLQAEAPPSSG